MAMNPATPPTAIRFARRTALAFCGTNTSGAGQRDVQYDFTSFPEVVQAVEAAYAQAGISDPNASLAMAEVHDLFTTTELVLMEDLGFAPRGE